MLEMMCNGVTKAMKYFALELLLSVSACKRAFFKLAKPLAWILSPTALVHAPKALEGPCMSELGLLIQPLE